MDDGESSGFCTNCGAPLHGSDTFCPHCGTNVKEGTPPVTIQQNKAGRNTTLTIVGVMCAIWAVISLYVGVVTATGVDEMIKMMMEDPEIWAQIEPYQEVLRTTLLVMGVLLIIDGILCVVAAVTCLMEKYYIVAFGSCLIASILLLIGLLGIVGLIMSYLIYKNKDSFKERNPYTNVR